MDKRRILFVYNTPQPFVKADLEMLRQDWQVVERYERSPRINPLAVARAVMRVDLVYAWFASWHSLLPILFAKLLRKPSVVVVGGYDVANLPEAGYGSQRGGWRKRLANTTMTNADRLIAFSNSARDETIRNAGIHPDKVDMIYLGVEPYPPGTFDAREPMVLTVGGVWHENLLRKGLLPFVQAARLLPNVQFVLAGKWYDDSVETLRAAAGSNVTLAGYVSDDTLTGYFQQASVYVQASQHEGFGLSVAEAMSAGCVPVVTRSGSLPEVVGDAGVYAASNDPADLAAAIRHALDQADSSQRQHARARILTQFPSVNRRKAVNRVLMRLLNEG